MMNLTEYKFRKTKAQDDRHNSKIYFFAFREPRNGDTSEKLVTSHNCLYTK